MISLAYSPFEAAESKRVSGFRVKTRYRKEAIQKVVCVIGAAVEVAILADVVGFGGLSETMGVLNNSKEWMAKLGWIDLVHLVKLVERKNWWDLEEGRRDWVSTIDLLGRRVLVLVRAIVLWVEGSVFLGTVCDNGGGGVGNTVEARGDARKEEKKGYYLIVSALGIEGFRPLNGRQSPLHFFSFDHRRVYSCLSVVVDEDDDDVDKLHRPNKCLTPSASEEDPHRFLWGHLGDCSRDLNSKLVVERQLAGEEAGVWMFQCYIWQGKSTSMTQAASYRLWRTKGENLKPFLLNANKMLV
ncbi:unnamed protein product [Ilex paraguariensis]|uniref:Uncharacterized protein n=1 Tax=Ilex paraguariensis TaxID=185542 RepID=A0ABC8S1H6_9AQUA